MEDSTDQSQQDQDLQKRIEKLESQKSMLLRELDDLEQRFEKTDKLYRKYMPVILDTFAGTDSPFSGICKDLGEALKKGASIGKLEYIFNQVRDIVIREDADIPQGKKGKSGFFSSLKKKSGTAVIEEFKTGYHDIINQLKSTLGERYTQRLGELTEKINQAETSGDIIEIRDDIFSIIQKYIADTNADRERINNFIQEVVERIFRLEAEVVKSFEQTGEILDSNEGFESVLDSEMNELQQNMDVAQNLEDLKQMIARRLAVIDKALKKKQAKDKAIREMANRHRDEFKTGFSKLKKELDKATANAKELEEELNIDQLTGAYNRRAYEKKIQEEMDRFKRYGTTFSLLMIDADKFKNINDKYGHAIGDKCLKEIIKRTIPQLRVSDMLARWGGEEFVVIMPETPLAGARDAAEKIRSTIEKIEFVYREETVKVTVSIGVSEVEKSDETYRKVFERADIALYQAKKKGRNQVVASN